MKELFVVPRCHDLVIFNSRQSDCLGIPVKKDFMAILISFILYEYINGSTIAFKIINPFEINPSINLLFDDCLVSVN